MRTLINGADAVVQSTKNVIFPNNFTALHNYISKVTTGDKIGKFVAIHNFPSLKSSVFYPRNIFGLGVIRTFISKKQRRKMVNICNHSKSSCKMFYVKMFYYSQKELEHFGPEMSLVRGILAYFEFKFRKIFEL